MFMGSHQVVSKHSILSAQRKNKVAAMKVRVEEPATSEMEESDSLNWFKNEALPGFAGEDPIGWISKAESFFEEEKIHSSHKTQWAFMRMEGVAHEWFFSWCQEDLDAGWESFAMDLIKRFKEPESRKRDEEEEPIEKIHSDDDEPKWDRSDEEPSPAELSPESRLWPLEEVKWDEEPPPESLQSPSLQLLPLLLPLSPEPLDAAICADKEIVEWGRKEEYYKEEKGEHHIRMFNLPLESRVVTSQLDDQLISPTLGVDEAKTRFAEGMVEEERTDWEGGEADRAFQKEQPPPEPPPELKLSLPPTFVAVMVGLQPVSDFGERCLSFVAENCNRY